MFLRKDRKYRLTLLKGLRTIVWGRLKGNPMLFLNPSIATFFGYK
jgi:hypothetical protein